MMTTLSTKPRHSTLVTAAIPAELSPIEARLMDVCNLLHESVAADDARRTADLHAEAEFLLDEYERTGAEDHPNPSWAAPNQRALVASALGEVQRAIELELDALPHADTPRRREISFGNLADRCVRAGRAVDAVGYFLSAYDAAPDSVPVMVTGGQALFLAGHATEANRLFREVLAQARRNPALLSPTGELGAYLDFETRLAAIAPDLPALAELIELWRSAR